MAWSWTAVEFSLLPLGRRRFFFCSSASRWPGLGRRWSSPCCLWADGVSSSVLQLLDGLVLDGGGVLLVAFGPTAFLLLFFSFSMAWSWTAVEFSLLPLGRRRFF